MKTQPDIDDLVAKYITRETHKGSVNRVRHLMARELKTALYTRLAAEAITLRFGLNKGETVEAIPIDKLKAIMEIKEL